MKMIVVTGASRGIGRSIAEAAVDDGYRVIGLARNPLGDERYRMVTCDVRSADEIDAFFSALKDEKDFFGLVNAAGVLNTKSIIRYSQADIQNIVNTNLIGTILMSKAAVRAMLPARRGRILNFSSIAASIGLKGDSVYSATKAGVETFSRALAREVADRGITVNCVAPGPIETDMTRNLTESQWSSLIAQQIVQRRIAKDELWPLVRFLLSDEAGVVTGDVLHVGGV